MSEPCEIKIADHVLRSSIQRPRPTPSTTCAPYLNLRSSSATEPLVRPKMARATTLLTKVASQPTSPRTLTPTTSCGGSTGSGDYFDLNIPISKGCASAANELPRQHKTSVCEKSSQSLLLVLFSTTIADEPSSIFQLPRFRKVQLPANL